MPEEEPQLVVHHQPPLGQVGEAPHPEEAPSEVSVPITEPVSYTILISPPDGELIAFSDEQGHKPDRYDGARFFLGPEGIGSFTFMPAGTEISIEGSGTMSASEERVIFENPDRGLSGVFSFPRGDQRGEITLTDGSVHLKARAVQGIPID